MALSTEDREEIKGMIKSVVNGKIDKMSEKLDAHILTLEPISEAIMWINSTRKFLLWSSAIVVSFISTITLFKYLK